MNLNEYEGSFLLNSPTSFSHSFIPNTAKLERFTYMQYTEFGVVGPLGESFDLFSPLGFDVKTNSDHKTQKIKLYSVRALKRYLNEINLICGRVMASISDFSPQIFETYQYITKSVILVGGT